MNPSATRHQALAYARHDLNMARINLWRARQWNYSSLHLRHFERLVCVALDHVWDCQQMLAKTAQIS